MLIDLPKKSPANDGFDQKPGAGLFKPRLNYLLESLRLDVTYERGQGSSLYYRNELGQEVEVLDFIGGYGSLLLGHSHPALVAEAVKLLNQQRPTHAQGSTRAYARQLAAELSGRLGGKYCVVFANSGAEAVEGAMKHAMLETGHKKFLALEGAFHGKTLGALQLTANTEYRDGFILPGLEVVRVPPNDATALERAFTQHLDLAGFIFEPIQGEGGVKPLEPEYGQKAAALCARHGVPLIADECQTGVGRTGTFLACEQLGIKPNYIILSKALGGGLAKISALLVEQSRYVDEFDLKHTSTFADDDASCAIALKTLELIDSALLDQVTNKGAQWLAALRALAEQYPDVIADVRGLGLMLGVELKPVNMAAGMVLRFLSAQEDLAFVLMGYFLHTHRIRIAPTLSEPFTLRLEPSVLISDREMDRLVRALEDVCQRLRHRDVTGLTSFLAAPCLPRAAEFVRSHGKLFALDEARCRPTRSQAGLARVAWLCHLVDADDLIPLDPDFRTWSASRREWFLERSLVRAWPIALGGVEIRSRTGQSVWFCPILLPFTSRWAKRQIDNRNRSGARALVQRGIDLAYTLGCQMVALGQYTSILTSNGIRLDPRSMGITTGNTYALRLALQAIQRTEQELDRPQEDSILAVVGATGNIGRAAAEMLAPLYRETLLVGRNSPSARRRLEALSGCLPRTRVATELGCARQADVVLVAMNAVDRPLQPAHFKLHAIVCDVSVPAALAASTRALRPDLRLMHGGIAGLPGGEDLQIVGFPLPAGQVYGCMAEAMLLGFEGVRDSRFTGSIRSDQLRVLEAMAQRHGFELADRKSFQTVSAELKEECYAFG